MSWFSRSRRGEDGHEDVLETGPHRSPGLALALAEVGNRELAGVLDLGAPSNESLAFLSRLTPRVSVQDLYRSVVADGKATGIGFRDADALPLPEERASFDLVLLWDLLHYLAPAARPRLGRRLAELCRPGAIVLLHAADGAPVPASPIQFRVLSRDTLLYGVPDGPRLPPPKLSARMVEKALPGFRPLRIVQLRHGLQEAVFQLDPALAPVAPVEAEG